VYSTLLFFPCYSNPLLRRWRWIRILRQGVLGYVLPQLPFLWCCGVFCYSVSLRVILAFRDIIYVIIILYSWHLINYEHFWSCVWNNWSWVMHTMSTWFWHTNQVWESSCLYSYWRRISMVYWSSVSLALSLLICFLVALARWAATCLLVMISCSWWNLSISCWTLASSSSSAASSSKVSSSQSSTWICSTYVLS
jgi:hypothetical protein